MGNSISGSVFNQARAAILCLGSGLLLFGLSAAAHAAQPGTDSYSTNSDLLTIQLEHYDIMRLAAYQFGSKVGVAETADTADNVVPGASRFGATTGLPSFIKLLKMPSWVASIGWHMTADSDRASLSPNLRVESKENLFVIKPTNHSVSMVWHRKFD
ncbi:MAG: hypothetical protein WBQ69_08940 [Gallionella sp.]